MTEHLTTTEFDGYQRGRLSPEELLRADDHIAVCEVCRTRLASSLDVDKMSRAWEAEFQSEPRRPVLRYLGIAAAVTLFVAAGLLLRHDSDLRGLTPEQQQTVRMALRDSKLSFPSWTAELAGRGEILMGARTTEASLLLSPVATAVMEEQPVFRWRAMPGAHDYEVILQNEASGQTLRSDRVLGLEWRPPQPLARGTRYVWQLVTGGTSFPKPPDPPARFYVVESDVAQRLSRLTAPPIVRAVLYAEAGLIDAAASELETELRQKPDSALARTWLAMIKQQKVPRP